MVFIEIGNRPKRVGKRKRLEQTRPKLKVVGLKKAQRKRKRPEQTRPKFAFAFPFSDGG